MAARALSGLGLQAPPWSGLTRGDALNLNALIAGPSLDRRRRKRRLFRWGRFKTALFCTGLHRAKERY